MHKYKYIMYRLLLGGLNNVTSKFVVMELNFAWYLMLRNIISGFFMHGSKAKFLELKEYF